MVMTLKTITTPFSDTAIKCQIVELNSPAFLRSKEKFIGSPLKLAVPTGINNKEMLFSIKAKRKRVCLRCIIVQI